MKIALAVVFLLLLVCGGTYLSCSLRREPAPVPAAPFAAPTAPPAPHAPASAFPAAPDPRVEELATRLEQLTAEVAQLRTALLRVPVEPGAQALPTESDEQFLELRRDAIRQVIEEDRQRLLLETRIQTEAVFVPGFVERNNLSPQHVASIQEILSRWQHRGMELRARQGPMPQLRRGEQSNAQHQALGAAWVELRGQRTAELVALLGSSLGLELVELTRQADPERYAW